MQNTLQQLTSAEKSEILWGLGALVPVVDKGKISITNFATCCGARPTHPEALGKAFYLDGQKPTSIGKFSTHLKESFLIPDEHCNLTIHWNNV